MVYDNIKLRQRCNYGDIFLKTAGSKIFPNNFLLVPSGQNWQRIAQEFDALKKENPTTESNSKFIKILVNVLSKVKMKTLMIMKMQLFLS